MLEKCIHVQKGLEENGKLVVVCLHPPQNIALGNRYCVVDISPFTLQEVGAIRTPIRQIARVIYWHSWLLYYSY